MLKLAPDYMSKYKLRTVDFAQSNDIPFETSV